MQLWATGDWQLHHNNMSTHASCFMQNFFLEKHQITQVTHLPLQPRFGTLRLLAFPKTKTTFEREEISDLQRDSGKYNRAANGDWENSVGPKLPDLKGTEVSLSYIQCFLYHVSSSINISIFHITWLDTFCICIYILYLQLNYKVLESGPISFMCVFNCLYNMRGKVSS